MNPGRIIVLAIALIAALGAAMLMRNLSSNKPSDIQAQAEVAPPPSKTDQVLVARKDISIGQRVTPEDLAWQEWPDGALNKAFLTQQQNPKALEEYAGAVARQDIAAGEPVSARKLVNPGGAGFMAAVLTPGMRAVSVEISVETGAGGFILPNDRVDVILTKEVQVENGDTVRSDHSSRTILENVRVLAIDQSFKQSGDKDEEVVIGSTATLELNRADAELLARSEASGDLSLALRSLADSVPGMNDGARSHATGRSTARALVVYRYGTPTKMALEDQ